MHEKIRAKAGKERLKNSSHVHPNGVGPRSVTLPKKSQKWKRVLNEKETLEIRKKEWDVPSKWVAITAHFVVIRFNFRCIFAIYNNMERRRSRKMIRMVFIEFCWMKWYLESFLVHTVLLSWKNLSLLNGSFLAILPWNIAPQNCNHTIHCQCATKQWNCNICRKMSVFTTFKGC